MKREFTEETRRVRAGGRGGDEDISEEEEMYVRNKDEVSEGYHEYFLLFDTIFEFLCLNTLFLLCIKNTCVWA